MGPAVPTMEGIVNFHNHVMIVILFIYCYKKCQFYAFKRIRNYLDVHSSFNSCCIGNSIVYTIIFHELIDPVINFKIIGHQWYWSYELSDYSLCGTQSEDNNFKYDCYMLVLDSLAENKKGYYRLLETNKRLLFPSNTHLRLFISAADVLHSWTVPFWSKSGC